MQPRMAMHISVFLPKALYNFRGVYLNSTLVVARTAITKGLNIKITVRNIFLIGTGLGEFGGLDWICA